MLQVEIISNHIKQDFQIAVNNALERRGRSVTDVELSTSYNGVTVTYTAMVKYQDNNHTDKKDT